MTTPIESWDEELFYGLMQSYRYALLSQQGAVTEAYERVKDLFAAELEARKRAEAERDELKKERTSYRTLNSILGDNGQIVELEQERDKANALIEQLEKVILDTVEDQAIRREQWDALEFIRKHREGK